MSKSNSAFYLLKVRDLDKRENFKAWNIRKSTTKFLEPRGDSSETTENEEEEEDTNSPPNEINVEDQASSTGDSENDPNEEKEENKTMTMCPPHHPTSQAMIAQHQLLLRMLFLILLG